MEIATSPGRSPRVAGRHSCRMTIRGQPEGHALARNDRDQRHYPSISQQPSANSNGKGYSAPSSKPRYPHIKDLQAKATSTHNFSGYTPVGNDSLAAGFPGQRWLTLTDTYTAGASTTIGESSECRHHIRQARAGLR